MLGLLLIAAALLKAYDASHRELEEKAIWTTRWFVACLVVLELVLGMWLASGFAPKLSRLFGLFVFSVFFEFALYQGFVGEASCRCFGKLTLSPWAAAAVDVGAIALLLAWRPLTAVPVRGSTKNFAVMSVLGAATVAFLMNGIVQYSHAGPVRLLRGDQRLAVRLDLRLKNAEVSEVLEKVRAATGVPCILARELQERQPPLGHLDAARARAWAVLELIAEKQPVPARWVRSGSGFELATTTSLGGPLPWTVVAALVVGWFVVTLVRRPRLHNKPGVS